MAKQRDYERIEEVVCEAGYVEMSGSDSRMDQAGNFDWPSNEWPVQCKHCTFPDIDFVPQPYWLTKGIAAPGDMAPAELGNFFVRERTQKILEAVAPGACRYYPTQDKKTSRPTEWRLAVPAKLVRTADVDKRVPRCPKCGEPRAVHPGSHFRLCPIKPGGAEVFKSEQWGSSESIGEKSGWYWMHILGLKQAPKAPPHQWTRLSLSRDLFFSNRLYLLVKTLKLKGFAYSAFHEFHPTAADKAWVDEQLVRLTKLGLAGDAGTAKKSAKKPGASWLKAYLREHGAIGMAKLADVRAWEKKHKLKLPADYVSYVTEMRNRAFEDVDGQEGFEVSVLPPKKLDARSFRLGKVENEEEVDGLMFAATGHGDAFCFDLRGKPAKNPPVYHYQHEQDHFEPYANNFAEAIRRFVGE
jgi:hypothetical protein